MSTEAPPATTEQDGSSMQLLDHRTRNRAVVERLARRGPHLALADGLQTRLIPLGAKLTHIGRNPGSEVRIDDHAVSGSHAIIVRHGRYARILDNRSSTGTFLNGRRIVATNLQSGDMISVGPVTMQFVEVA